MDQNYGVSGCLSAVRARKLERDEIPIRSSFSIRKAHMSEIDARTVPHIACRNLPKYLRKDFQRATRKAPILESLELFREPA